MIRQAGEDDIPVLLYWLSEFHRASFFDSVIPFDVSSTEDTIRKLLGGDNAVVLMHDYGVIGGLIVPFFFNDARTQAIEMFWYAKRDGAALMKAFEDWAVRNGADVTIMGSLPGERQDTVNMIYRRRGYSHGEVLHWKEN